MNLFSFPAKCVFCTCITFAINISLIDLKMNAKMYYSTSCIASKIKYYYYKIIAQRLSDFALPWSLYKEYQEFDFHGFVTSNTLTYNNNRYVWGDVVKFLWHVWVRWFNKVKNYCLLLCEAHRLSRVNRFWALYQQLFDSKCIKE